MGPVTILLLAGVANGAVLAGLCLTTAQNRTANCFLSLLIALVSLRMTIYVLGFAGSYDSYAWLTFLPLDVSFAFGPLLWLYVATLAQSEPPARWQRHLAPAALQIVYYLACFALPQPAKWDWYSGWHLDVVEPIGTVVVLISTAFYTARAWCEHRTYQRWLDDHFADRDPWRLDWLRAMIACFALAWMVTIAAAFWHVFIRPLDYFGRTPVMLGFAALVYALGLLGWRYGSVAYPPQRLALPSEAAREPRTDYTLLVSDWRRRIESGGWWREEQLTLADVARRLAVSERTLSRGLNLGAATNFNAFINGMRVAAAQRAIADGWRDDLLALAFNCGFASKASFNRAFRAHTGMNPTAWRVAQNPPEIATGMI